MTATSTRDVNGRTYRRDPVKTHKVGIGEDLGGVIALYAAERITPQTTLCLSQKFVSICNGDVRHISEVQDSWLARLIVKYVQKNDNGDIGYSHPKKMQVAIDEVGYPRMLAAVVGGGIGKFVLRRNGDFYRIAGQPHLRDRRLQPRGHAPVRPVRDAALEAPRRHLRGARASGSGAPRTSSTATTSTSRSSGAAATCPCPRPTPARSCWTTPWARATSSPRCS